MAERPRFRRAASSRAALGLGLGLGLLAPGPGAAQEPDAESWRIERLDERVELPAGAALEVENPLGEIRVRVGEAGTVEVHAVVQRHAEDGRAPKVAIEDVPSGKKIVATFAAGAPGLASPDFARRRIDLAVAVPPNTALGLRTDSGLIEVKGGVGNLEAESVSGDVRLWVGRPVRVRTERGAIAAYLLGRSWAQSASFETRTGPIEVELPARADVDLRLETSGRLATDYSVEVEWTGRLHKRATGRIGGGGAEVRLRSENGPLAILRRMPGGSEAPALESDRQLR